MRLPLMETLVAPTNLWHTAAPSLIYFMGRNFLLEFTGLTCLNVNGPSRPPLFDPIVVPSFAECVGRACAHHPIKRAFRFPHVRVVAATRAAEGHTFCRLMRSGSATTQAGHRLFIVEVLEPDRCLALDVKEARTHRPLRCTSRNTLCSSLDRPLMLTSITSGLYLPHRYLF